MKPKLIHQSSSGLGSIYGAQPSNGVHFNSQEDSQMDLDELAKHLGIKVSDTNFVELSSAL